MWPGSTASSPACSATPRPRWSRSGARTAAAFDSATALERARRKAATATVLLGLATSLAQLTGTRDITRRLATAITELVDCDGALVFDPVAGRGRIVAAEGCDPEALRRFRAARLRVPQAHLHPPAFRVVRVEEEPHAPTRRLMQIGGAVARAMVPLVARGQWIGSLVARWRIGPSACSPARGATARRWE